LAAALRRGIQETSTKEAPQKNPMVYTCINKALLNDNPDDPKALQLSMECYQHALSTGAPYSESYAGVALAAMTLAGFTAHPKTRELIGLARKNSAAALQLNRENVNANLTEAMLKWQIDGEFEIALMKLQKLVKQAPNAWQVHHQLGMLMLTMGRYDGDAVKQLGQAERLATMAKSLATDVARAQWFRGNDDRARDIAALALGTDSSDDFARGMLIDLYEQKGDLNSAAAYDPQLGGEGVFQWTHEAYFSKRNKRLEALPYGPFGPVSNDVIWRQRASREETRFTEFRAWSDTWSPSMPLLLARHPALLEMRESDHGAEWLRLATQSVTNANGI
ncbi:MAG: hypothetical protein AAF989_13945, partial [Planctomycetota bacterium]